MKSSLRPTIQAFLIADSVASDTATGRTNIAGIFHHFSVAPDPREGLSELRRDSAEPTPLHNPHSPSPVAYLNLTNLRGTQPLVLRYVNLANEQVCFECAFEVASDHPLLAGEFVIPLPSLPVDRAGTFALELLWNNEPLAVSRMIVAPNEKPVPTEGEFNG